MSPTRDDAAMGTTEHERFKLPSAIAETVGQAAHAELQLALVMQNAPEWKDMTSEARLAWTAVGKEAVRMTLMYLRYHGWKIEPSTR